MGRTRRRLIARIGIEELRFHKDEELYSTNIRTLTLPLGSLLWIGATAGVGGRAMQL